MFWINSHTHAIIKIPLRVQWNTHIKSNDFSMGEGWVSRRSAQVVRELLWEVSHSEGVTGRSPLRTRRAHRAFLGITVSRVSRRLSLGISNFHPGHNPHNVILILRQQLYNSSTTQNVQFWHLPGWCDSKHREFQVLSGSAWSAQLTALGQRQGKCQVVPIHCTAASYSCSASKNTMLAGSGTSRCEGWLHHHTQDNDPLEKKGTCRTGTSIPLKICSSMHTGNQCQPKTKCLV